MMGDYVLSVTAVSLICSVVLTFPAEKTFKLLLRLACGILLTVTVFAPMKELSVPDVLGLRTDYGREAQYAVDTGEYLARQARAAIIKQQTQAYILDKAAAMGLTVQAEVILSEDHIPAAVRIGPEPEPQDKEALSRILTGDLGIPKENQQWSGSEQKKP